MRWDDYDAQNVVGAKRSQFGMRAIEEVGARRAETVKHGGAIGYGRGVTQIGSRPLPGMPRTRAAGERVGIDLAVTGMAHHKRSTRIRWG